ncbi:uncharacterized protein LOC131695074 [Topomyia yanbarensis]|uniref:uncharacterized protein LOC131695074 n=1 Tax=Topomyia yanbarensis TaxID=2498891 RepID=UPI00273C80CA|nr:uncharacterized protein LOC131695074 [Topomyia yanbarensis]XP_058839587.1 uncharacterized protein LOC131695074 [Topomyia yanbarensis]
MDPLMCRLCLTPNSGTVALYNQQTMEPNILLIQKVVECTSIKLSVADDYPSSVCSDCIQKLNEWSTFKIQCIVNNDFYRKKQSELRKQLLTDTQQATEVVCLDDSDDEQLPQVKEPPPKKAKIEQHVVIDDDDSSYEHSQLLMGTRVANSKSLDPTPMFRGEVGGQRGRDCYEQEDTSLDDYELIDGQEVEPYPLDQQYSMDSSAILSSILLDDDESSSSLVEEAEPGLYEKDLFGCTFCKRRYSSERKLRTHEKLHQENRMKCFVCGKWIVLQMVRHLRSQHPGQSFPEPVRCWHSKCVHSPVLYHDVDQLLAHMETKRRK